MLKGQKQVRRFKARSGGESLSWPRPQQASVQCRTPPFASQERLQSVAVTTSPAFPSPRRSAEPIEIPAALPPSVETGEGGVGKNHGFIQLGHRS